jgi:hypothetical protein
MSQWLSERLANHSSLITDRAVRAISGPKRSCACQRTTTRSCLSAPKTRTTRRSMKSSISTSSRHRTRRRDHARTVCHGGQSNRPGPDSSEVHRLCQGQSSQAQAWRRLVSEPAHIWRASCSTRSRAIVWDSSRPRGEGRRLRWIAPRVQ